MGQLIRSSQQICSASMVLTENLMKEDSQCLVSSSPSGIPDASPLGKCQFTVANAGPAGYRH